MKLSPAPKRRLKRYQRCSRAQSKFRTSRLHRHPFPLSLSLSPGQRERRRPVRHIMIALCSETSGQGFSFSQRERDGVRGKEPLKRLRCQKLICGRCSGGLKPVIELVVLAEREQETYYGGRLSCIGAAYAPATGKPGGAAQLGRELGGATDSVVLRP